MKKILLPLTLLTLSIGFNLVDFDSFDIVKAEENTYVSDFIYEENGENTLKVIGVKDSSKNKTNLRIYGYEDGIKETGKIINEIALNAFEGVNNLTSLMISDNILTIANNALDIASLQTIYYTGELSKWTELNYDTNVTVIDYSFDEGFINYWNKFIRPSEETSICAITNDTYLTLKNKYQALGTLDKQNVNSYEDKAGDKIEDSIKYLDAYFSPKEDKPKENKISKDVALTIVIGIAIFGMTSIAVFYLLMKKNIIS